MYERMSNFLDFFEVQDIRRGFEFLIDKIRLWDQQCRWFLWFQMQTNDRKFENQRDRFTLISCLTAELKGIRNHGGGKFECLLDSVPPPKNCLTAKLKELFRLYEKYPTIFDRINSFLCRIFFFFFNFFYKIGTFNGLTTQLISKIRGNLSENEIIILNLWSNGAFNFVIRQFLHSRFFIDVACWRKI